ncbi:MAG: DUF3800 domain-containing protein [Bacteroidaceae bacterium]|nr:DUF3800 domain-containing protein [Bacteroidaceae bacterium]
MDYSRVYQLNRLMALAQGVSEEQYDKKETWYYDETDNVKHLVLLPEKRVNASENACFVLGGVQAEDIVSDDELHTALGKEPGRELKSTKDLRGSFVEILRKDAFKRTFDLVESKRWNVHFIMVQVWYYAFVDVIDSICDDVMLAHNLKAILYRILKSSPEETVKLFGKYRYPDIKDKDKIVFLDGLEAKVLKFIGTVPNPHDKMMASILVKKINEAKKKDELTFIQDETPDEWVKMFVQFYSAEIYSYPNRTLVFDTEKQVEKLLTEDTIEVNGTKLNNYSFSDSATNPMIQVCDYVVSILRKYFIFVDRTLNEIVADIEKFDKQQMQRYRLLNKVLKRSLDNNPLFFHYIASVETQYNINQLMEKYA